MDFIKWDFEIDVSITACDRQGIIVYLNKKALSVFEKHGGEKLAGASIFDCHPEPAKSKLKELMLSQKTNIYTIEKNGIKKIIIQKPWYAEGRYKGFVEIVSEIPESMPHYIRQ